MEKNKVRVEDLKIVKQAPFSEGYAPAITEDGRIYIIAEDGTAKATQFISISSQIWDLEQAELSPFTNGLCVVITKDTDIDYQIEAYYDAIALWLTKDGFGVQSAHSTDLSIYENDPLLVERKGNLDFRTAYSNLRERLENIDTAKEVFENPQDFKKIMKQGKMKSSSSLKAYASVASHAFENILREAEQGAEEKKQNGEQASIDYDACYKQISKYVEDLQKDLAKMLKKASKRERW